MAESNSGGTPRGPEQPKELSMELRLLIAFILMGVVLFLTPYFYKAVVPPAKKTAPIAAKTAPAAAPGPAAVSEPGANASAAPPESAVPPVAAQNEETRIIDTDLFRITFSNRGALVKSWQLKKYKAHSGAPLELVNTASHADLPGALFFPTQKPAVDLNQALYKMDSDTLSISFDYSNGSVAARKSFRFAKSSYLVDVTTEVTQGGGPLAHEIEWRGGFGDMGVANPAGAQQTLRFDLTDAKLVKSGAKAAKDGPVTVTGNYSFAGIEDQYFVAAFLPDRATSAAMTTFSDNAATPLETKELPFAGAAVGDGPVNRFALYVGPKDIDILRSVNPRLEQVVDFGWFSILAKPLFLIVNWMTDHAIHNYGWSIIVVTIALNFVLFPLKITSMKSMKKMQALQPQIAAINDKYKGVSLRDPRKSDQNQEVMELYKKHGVNPMGGCVPMVLQIPFFIAFYKVFSVSVEMRGANWLWVTDLSQPETLPIHLLPIIMVVSQFVMQKMTPTTTGGDPSQQKMMQFMPLIFGFMFYNLSSGLVLYYLTSNLVGVAQQWFFNRTSLAAVAAQSVQPPKKKNGRK
ncbi:MAG TPA: membrane protein insertase YidC [Bryobacteraceae bacterium]|nr:membrane protein insertase YidC [Bryobacteraceae bacterium]